MMRLLALVTALAVPCGAQANGTHYIHTSYILACKDFDRNEALKEDFRHMRFAPNYFALQRLAQGGECRLFHGGDHVYLQSRRSAAHVCVRPVGHPECYWLPERVVRRVR